MSDDILGQGLELMLYGMGTVVVFLTLLVVVTTAMSRFMGRFFPEPVVTSQPRRKAAANAADGEVKAEVVAAITAAIRQHRRSRH